MILTRCELSCFMFSLNTKGGHCYLDPVLVDCKVYTVDPSSSLGVIEYTGYGVLNSV